MQNTAFIAIFKKVPIKMAYLRYAVCGCCLGIKNANCYKRVTVCSDTGDTLNVTACLIVAEDKKHPGRFRFYGILRGDGAIGDYSSSVSSDFY